jgi:DNA-binding SARP family transcriptional activator/tetratricopeptide (TPR) repeat protein
MPLLSLALLGGFEARVGSKVISLPRKARALLAYLALDRSPTHSRATLATLLWSDASEGDARNNLRQVLFRTRRALGRASRVLSIDGDAAGLDLAAVDSDVATLRDLVADGDDKALRTAAALCRGTLLEGCEVTEPVFEEWLTHQREQIHALAIAALVELVQREERQQALDGVVAASVRILGLDVLQEGAHRALMRAYAGLGRRAAALRQYQSCVDVLAREVQAEPEPETKALYLELLRQSSTRARTVAPDAPALRDRAGTTSLPLVGRGAELGTVTRTLDDALAGTGRIAAVLGEAGIGKTRLVEEVLRHAVTRGCRILQARAYETERRLAFGLWVSALRSAGVVENPALIEALGAEWRDALNPLFPELPGRRRRGSVETENQRRLFEALSRLLATAAAAQPLVVVLEDLQWADATSLSLLAFLGRRLGGVRAPILVTARLEDIERGGPLTTVLSELRREDRLVELALSPLSRADTHRLIESLAPRTRLTPELSDRIWQMGEGNPFVTAEAMRAAGRWSAAAVALPLPERVRQLIGDRIDRLSSPARHLVAAAAVVGGAFEYRLLCRAASMADGEAAEAVEELLRRRVFRQVAEHFDFAHDRIREAVLGTLIGPQRRRLHLAVAAAIVETRGPDLDDHQAVLAAHYEQGEDWLRAVDCLRQASMVTASRGAFREAADLLERALVLLAKLPRDQDTLGRAVDVRVELWDRVVVLPDFERGEGCLLEAQRLAIDLGDERRAAFVASSLSNHDVQVRNFERGRRLAEESLAFAERAGGDVIAARAANALGLIRYASGDLVGAIEAFTRGIKAAGDDPLTTFSVGVGLCHVHLRGHQAIIFAELGRFEDALRLAEDARDRAESVRNLFSMAFAHYAFARVLLMRGDFDRALGSLATGFELVEAYAIGLVRRMYVVWLTVAYAQLGRPEAALPLASQGPPLWPMTHIARARALLAAGRPADASTAAHEGLAMTRRIGEQTQETAALVLLAEIHGGPDAPLEPARSHCEAALAIAKRLGLRAFQVHCHRQLGERLAAAGQRRPAREHLVEALALYREMDMHRWVNGTATLLARIEDD